MAFLQGSDDSPSHERRSRKTRASIAKATPRQPVADEAAFANNRTAMAGFLAARSHYWRGHFFTFFKRHRRAIQEFERALALDPGMLEAWRGAGFLYAQEKESGKAVAALQAAVKLAPDDADTRFNLGFLHHERGELDAAVTQFKEALRLKPLLDRAWYGLGLIYLDRRDLPAAIEHLQQAAKLQYFNPHAGHQLAIAYHRAGEHDKAVAELKRVESYDPKLGAQIAHDIGAR
jgi:tetratricopeptide (TPR) repeat protein